jgi:hypothetical protein
MGADFTIRPVGAPAPIPVARSVSKTEDVAVPTQLPSPQSVTAVDTAGESRNDPATQRDDVSHQVTFDRSAAQIVYQVVNARTDLVVDQIPDEAALRRRAYFRALDDEAAARHVTDRKA